MRQHGLLLTTVWDDMCPSDGLGECDLRRQQRAFILDQRDIVVMRGCGAGSTGVLVTGAVSEEDLGAWSSELVGTRVVAVGVISCMR